MPVLKHPLNIHRILSATTAILFFCLAYETNAQQPDTLHDKDGNIYTTGIFSDNKKWMTVNLKTNIPGSFGYNNAEEKNSQYGRLYTWKAAQEGCRLLGEGWRLPGNQEWQNMAKPYGGVRDDSNDGGKSAYAALANSGKSLFNIVYGGGRDSADGSYARVDEHGFYWTATEVDSTHSWFYNFGKNGRIMNRHNDGVKSWAISVRCIRD